MIDEPASRLGRYLVRNWERVALVGGESLVYWLRKLIFRGAWLDHQVKRGSLEVVWDDGDDEFAYQHPAAGGRCSSSPRSRRGTSSSSSSSAGRGVPRRRCSRSTTTRPTRSSSRSAS